MSHLVEKRELIPFSCEDCIHIDPTNPLRCKAFDLIPIEVFGENHTKVVKGQKGDYVFQPRDGLKREYNNVYVMDED